MYVQSLSFALVIVIFPSSCLRPCAGAKLLTKLCYDLPCSRRKNRVSLYIFLLL